MTSSKNNTNTQDGAKSMKINSAPRNEKGHVLVDGRWHEILTSEDITIAGIAGRIMTTKLASARARREYGVMESNGRAWIAC